MTATITIAYRNNLPCAMALGYLESGRTITDAITALGRTIQSAYYGSRVWINISEQKLRITF